MIVADAHYIIMEFFPSHEFCKTKTGYYFSNTPKTTSDIEKTTSYVEKTISDIEKFISDIIFAPCNIWGK